MKNIISLALAICILFLLPFDVVATDFAKMITIQKTVVYKNASTKSDELATLKEGFKFIPIGETKNFWKFEFKKDDKKHDGYILKKHAEEQIIASSKTSSGNSAPAKETQKAKKMRLSGTHIDHNNKVVTKLSDMDNFSVFWGNTGKKIHITPGCKTFKNGVLFGSLANGKEAGHIDGWCGVCSKGWSDSQLKKNGNPYIKRAKT